MQQLQQLDRPQEQMVNLLLLLLQRQQHPMNKTHCLPGQLLNPAALQLLLLPSLLLL
jgi:hypothetical protein